MILAVCQNNTAFARESLSDLAMLLNATTITKSMEADMMKTLMENGNNITAVFNMDFRGIPNIKVYDVEQNDIVVSTGKTSDDAPDCRLGFASYCELGIKTSLFRGFFYNPDLYKKHLSSAKSNLDESIDKYRAMGTFNIEITQNRTRYYALQLKMGTIEVGGDSELSQQMLRDSIDDATKAACSAYNNGVVLGCQVNLVSCLYDILHEVISKITDAEELENSLRYHLIVLLTDAFKTVYRTVLSNAYPDADDHKGIRINSDEMYQYLRISERNRVIFDANASERILDNVINYSIDNGKVFDLISHTFTDKIINSVETDIEILKSTIDLIKLIISGNQLVYYPEPTN